VEPGLAAGRATQQNIEQDNEAKLSHPALPARRAKVWHFAAKFENSDAQGLPSMPD
jgi:hypothetical protein